MLSAVRVWSIAALARTMLVVGCVERPGQYEIRFQQVRAEDISRVLKDVAKNHNLSDITEKISQKGTSSVYDWDQPGFMTSRVQKQSISFYCFSVVPSIHCGRNFGLSASLWVLETQQIPIVRVIDEGWPVTNSRLPRLGRDLYSSILEAMWGRFGEANVQSIIVTP
jgi:hypothetical protein